MNVATAIGPLIAEGLAVARGPPQVLAGLSFEIAGGNILVLRGANASGKSTLLRIIAGLTLADAGTLSLSGRTWRPKDAERRSTCLYLGHAHALKDELSALENLKIALALDGIEASADACAHALDACGLGARHHVLVPAVARPEAPGWAGPVGVERQAALAA